MKTDAAGHAVRESTALTRDFAQTFGDAGKVVAAGLSGFGAGLTTRALSGGRVDMLQVATDAFGNALSSSLASQSSSASSTQEEKLPGWQQRMVSGPADPLYGTSLGVSDSYLNPSPSLFSDPVPRWNGYLTDTPVDGVFVGGNTTEPAAPQRVRAGDYGGSMERIARAQLGANASQREINNYVGQLFELNSVDARRIGADMQIVLPSADTPMATDGLKQYGQDIARGEQIKAAQAKAAQAKAAQRATDNAAYREAQRFAGFAADNQAYAAQAAAPAGTLRVNPETGLKDFLYSAKIDRQYSDAANAATAQAALDQRLASGPQLVPWDGRTAQSAVPAHPFYNSFEYSQALSVQDAIGTIAVPELAGAKAAALIGTVASRTASLWRGGDLAVSGAADAVALPATWGKNPLVFTTEATWNAPVRGLR